MLNCEDAAIARLPLENLIKEKTKCELKAIMYLELILDQAKLVDDEATQIWCDIALIALSEAVETKPQK